MPERGAALTRSGAIEYEVVRSRRRRRTIEITVDASRGVRVAAPQWTPEADIRSLIERRSEWIAKQQRRQPVVRAARQWVAGETVPYLGQPLTLHLEPTARKRVTVTLEDGRLRIDVPDSLEATERAPAIERAVLRWYAERASADIEPRVAHWARLAVRPPTRVLIRNQRQRWGSCAPDGSLRFNTRIVMADLALIDYVVVHELAHLAVPSHAAAFWVEVERMLPDYRERRASLRRAGASLTLA